MDGLAIYYYATMEFIAMQTRQIVEKMNDSGHGITSIFMSGSQCQNKILMELMAVTAKSGDADQLVRYFGFFISGWPRL